MRPASNPPGALPGFLATLPRRPDYPVAVDRDGRVADGHQVQGLPWLTLLDPGGHVAWYDSVAALGWPTTTELIARVRQALARAAAPPADLNNALADLSGSPTALRALHQQASRLLGPEPELASRIRVLRGFPIVINAWASSCAPCRSEFGLFAAASARYGRRVAFLGANTDDSPADAAAFLAQHPITYPSYRTTTANVTVIAPAGLSGLPTTIFINPAGKLTYIHTGQYNAQGTLNADIETYALGS